MTLQRIESVECEAFRVVLALAYLNLAALTFLHLNLDRCNHSLTCVLVGACLAMIEHIPLAVDLADRAMGVAIHYSRCDGIAFLINLATTCIDYGSAIGPRAQRIVAIAIGQSVVGCGQTKLAILGESAIDKHILILDFTNA